MRHLPLRSRVTAPSRLLLAVSVAALAAGCSSGSQRFSAPWSSAQAQHQQAFGGARPAGGEVTGSIPTRSVQSQALAPVGQAQPAQAQAQQPARSAEWTPPPSRLSAQPASPAVAAAPPPAAPPAQASAPAPQRMASRAPVPPSRPAYNFQPGAAPAPQQAQAPAATAQRQPPAAWSAGAAAPATHTVQQGDSVVSVARRYSVQPAALAEANQLGPSDRLRIGQQLAIPANARMAAAPAPAAQRQQAEPASTGSVTAARPVPPLPAAAAQQASAPAAPAPATPPAAQAAPAAQQQAAAEPARQAEFRWPVRGRVVTNFGRQPGGGNSDGIAIAVPAGTPVKAAENGVVAYAGSELRGYGNLVLVRHDGDWVTAYAHNSEVLVRRGDQVRRGQTIARAGQSGSVSQPQLHFEIRRGSTPVNPADHLNGG